MPSELSMMQDKAANVSSRNFFAENGKNKFEPLLIKTLCEPLLPHIPRSVHPNTISLLTHAVAWITALLAIMSAQLLPFDRALALLGAGIGMFFTMIGDCLDGLHARRTNQCTKLGEMMDHWLDAVAVPLAVVGMACALELPSWAMFSVVVTAALIYHAQLVLYHHTGKFIHPEPASGAEGQFGLAMGYVALAGLFYYVDRHQPWLDMTMAAIGVVATFVQLRCSTFYYPKLGRLVTEHLWFAALVTLFGVLYLLGALDLNYFVFAVVFTSFRICGTYVLKTIVNEPYDGRDWGLAVFALGIAALHYGLPIAQASAGADLQEPVSLFGIRITNLLAALSCAYAIARNFQDFARHYGALRPRAT